MNKPYVLLIDQGNTRIKYAITEYNTESAITLIDTEQLKKLKKQIGNVICATVKDNIADIKAELAAIGINLPVQQVHTEKSAFGVKIAYQDETRLGVDRYLALLAGYKLTSRATIVIDFGTALTIDAVSRDGQHKGGWILPGLKTSTRALLAHTDKIKLINDTEPSLSLGVNTESCVLNGLVVAHISAISHLIEEEFHGQKLSILVTGGDSGTYMPLLKQKFKGGNIDLKEVEALIFMGLKQYIA
ncbi:type III pantothenate kinase [Catenovulum sp. SM1970]|uniref:type III pantothenate kinase n=1 Tax=Marinifaba aquimaris TaxID=2741323 RepID=UPI0015722C0C|nr:type III pantothenate kinase [Marinifaba aquimaris]